MSSTPLIIASLAGQTAGEDLSAYVAQTGDLNAAFARASYSPSTGGLQFGTSVKLKEVATASGVTDHHYLATTAPTVGQVDVSCDVQFGSAGIAAGETVGVVVGDDGTGNNFLLCTIYNDSSHLTASIENHVNGVQTDIFGSTAPSVSGASNAIYTITLQIRGTPGAYTATMLYGPKGGTQSVVGTASVAVPSLVTAGRQVGVRMAVLSGPSNTEANGLFLNSFSAAQITALTAGTNTVGAGPASGSATATTTVASGGTSPYSYQLQRAPDASGSPGTYANVGSSGTALTATDSGLTVGSTYWYRWLITDSASPAANVYTTAVPFTAAAPGFSISTAPGSMVLQQGQSLILTVTGQATGGYTGTDVLSCTGLPAGVTASFSPAALTNGAGNSVLTLTAAGNAATGFGSIGVQASDGTLTATTPVLLQVNPPIGVVYPAVTNVLDSDLVTITRNGSTEQVQASVLKSYLSGGGS